MLSIAPRKKLCDDTYISVKNSLNQKRDDDNHVIINDFTPNSLQKYVSRKFVTNLLQNTKEKRFLIISHEFSLTGAPKAALMLANAIKDMYNTSPYIISLKNGDIRHEFKDFPTYILETPLLKDDFQELFNSFDVVIINSVCWDILKNLQHINKPRIIWWSHEYFEAKYYLNQISNFINKIDSFWAGSSVGLKQITNKFPSTKDKSTLMLYGLKELKINNRYIKKDNKLIFLLIGSIEYRKGTDILINAIKLLPDNIIKNVEFRIIGHVADNLFYRGLKNIISNIPAVKYIDAMSFDKLILEYQESDVIISCSRNDPMPIVVTYSLMFKKLCLCSDKIGTSELMENNKNCILFKSGDSKDLSIKIKEITTNKQSYEQIAANGYDVYKKYFSMEYFYSKVKNNIDSLIKK